MRVGTLTFHLAYNYGAVLQAYALQESIKKLGVQCEIINYNNNVISNNYRIKKIYELRSAKEVIKWILTIKNKEKLDLKFREFFRKYYNLSEKEYTKNNINEVNDIYDSIIVGSDQVWNFNLNGNDDTFLLDFVKESKKKNSFSASFGYKKIPKNFEGKTYNLLQDFNNISVRESQGKEILKNLSNKHIEVLIDPTLLLSKFDWDKLCSNIKYKKDYIFVYQIANTPTLIKFAKKLAKIKQCDIICINNSYKRYKGMINIKSASPEEFLAYIKNAKYIVTSSFHGVAFSINYEKNFFYELDEKKQNNNSRLENIIEKFGLRCREIKNCNNDFIDHNIDYTKKLCILHNERRKAINFLSKSVN